ncbi:MAG: hypothetical protein JWP18_822 [Solirubrobacterales bacterium]|nr:hypothetical protein [Solirubrobacterales bacterium]
MPHEDPVLRALCEGRTPWEQVAIVAGRQERAIHVRQLRDCGLTAKTIRTATAKHQLHRLHRGVRAVGVRRLSTSGRYWAAVLAAGLDTALSDLSGGAFHGLHGWTGKVHVAAPTHRRSHRGVDVHQLSGLMPSMVRPAGVFPVRLEDLDVVIATRPGHHGLGALIEALAAVRDEPGEGRTQRELEALVLLKLRSVKGLPPHGRNASVALGDGRMAQADLLFADRRVMVELDSRRWHEQRAAMDSDRRRDQQALAVGLITFRITWHHVVNEWDVVLADLLSRLGSGVLHERSL